MMVEPVISAHPLGDGYLGIYLRNGHSFRAWHHQPLGTTENAQLLLYRFSDEGDVLAVRPQGEAPMQWLHLSPEPTHCGAFAPVGGTRSPKRAARALGHVLASLILAALAIGGGGLAIAAMTATVNSAATSAETSAPAP